MKVFVGNANLIYKHIFLLNLEKYYFCLIQNYLPSVMKKYNKMKIIYVKYTTIILILVKKIKEEPTYINYMYDINKYIFHT